MTTDEQPDQIEERTPWVAPRLESLAADDTQGGISPAALEDSDGVLSS